MLSNFSPFSLALSLFSSESHSNIPAEIATSVANTQAQQTDLSQEKDEQRNFQAKLDAIAAKMHFQASNLGFGAGSAFRQFMTTHHSNEKITQTNQKAKISQLKANEKRSAQQFNLIVGPKVYLINSSAPKWDRLSLCGTGDRGYIAGATNTTQEVLIFDINNYMLQRLDAASTALSAQMPPRRGQNNIATSCKYKSFTIITEDPTQGIYHAAIADAALIVTQYMAESYSMVNATFAGRAWRPISLVNGSASAFAPIFGSQAQLFYTNGSNMYTSFGPSIYTLNPGDNPHREPVSYTDGIFDILENRGNNTQLKVPSFNQNYLPLPLTTINYNPVAIDPTIINQPYAPRTPLVRTMPFTLIAPADNYTSAALLTGIPHIGVMSSSRKLAANSGIGPNGILSIANCADMPEINTYAMDAVQGSQFVISYDVVNASANSSSVIGGPFIFNNFNLSIPAQPQIACFQNGTVIVGFLEDGTPATFTFNFLGHNVNPSPTPTPAPTFTPTPSVGLLPNVTIDVTIPPGVGNNFIPITAQIVAISNNTATVQLINEGGYTIVYHINGSTVPLFTNFTKDEIYTFDFKKNANASNNDPFTFIGCDAQGHCSTSTAKTSLEAAFNVGPNLALILPIALGGVTAICIAGGIWYCVLKYQREKEPPPDDWNVSDQRVKNLEEAEKKKGGPYYQMNNDGSLKGAKVY